MTDRPTGTDHPAATTADRPGPATPGRLVTLAEAAALSGQSTEAIRSRIRRRTLRSTRGNHGALMVHLDELETGRPRSTDRDHPAGHPVTPGRPPATDRPTEEATALRDRLEAVTAELAAERLDRAAERLEAAERHGRELAELRERVGRAEVQAEAASTAHAVAEAGTVRAEARADAVELEVRRLRRPWLERLVSAIRGEP